MRIPPQFSITLIEPTLSSRHVRRGFQIVPNFVKIFKPSRSANVAIPIRRYAGWTKYPIFPPYCSYRVPEIPGAQLDFTDNHAALYDPIGRLWYPVLRQLFSLATLDERFDEGRNIVMSEDVRACPFINAHAQALVPHGFK